MLLVLVFVSLKSKAQFVQWDTTNKYNYAYIYPDSTNTDSTSMVIMKLSYENTLYWSLAGTHINDSIVFGAAYKFYPITDSFIYIINKKLIWVDSVNNLKMKFQ